MITNEILKKRYRLVLIIEALLGSILIYFLIFYNPSYYNKTTVNSKDIKKNIITKNTTRISGENFYNTAVGISQTIYTSISEDDRPNAVILVRGDKKEDGILSTRLIHDPINAPILYIKKDGIPKSTLDEIKRLNPKGIFADRNNKIILIGDVDESIKNKLMKEKIRFRHIPGKDPFKLGKNIDNYLAALKGDYKNSIIVAPVEASDYALVQGPWSAHTGDGFLFINKNFISEDVVKLLNLRYDKAYLYMLGNEKLISKEVKKELLRYGHVQIIPGSEDIYKQSVNFARYKDVGKNFGWGISEAGHNFIFVNPKDWQNAVAASLLAYKGNQGPMILVNKDGIPKEVKEYLDIVKPMNTYSQGQIYNHGWIIGAKDSISENVQNELDEFLEWRDEK